MCLTDKCCYFLKIDLGCIVLGVCHFILSLAVFIASAIFLCKGGEAWHDSIPLSRIFWSTSKQQIEPINAEKTWHCIIMWGALIGALIAMVCSILLVVGIRKRKAGLVLWYFAFGILLTIVNQLVALLALLHVYWITALVIFITSLLYIHCLVVISSLHEGLVKGQEFNFSPHQPILDDDESGIFNVDD